MVSEEGETATLKSEMFCVNGDEVLPAKVEFVEVKTATTECVPAVRELVENLAAPLFSVTVAAAVLLPSRKKLTEPAWVPDTEEETVAVKLTDLPAGDGLALEVMTAVVIAGLMTSPKAPEVLAAKLRSPE